MTRKTILLLSLLLFALAGVIAAAAGGQLFRVAVLGRPGIGSLPAASAEYGRIYEQFLARDSAMDISGTVRIYDQERSGVLKEEKPFHFCRAGRQYFSQLSYLRTYCDGELVLVVDTVHGQMNVTRAPAHARDVAAAGMPIEALFSDTARFRFSGQVEQEGVGRVLSLRCNSSPGIRVCRIYYDTTSYRLQRMEIEWWKDQSGIDTAAGRIWLSKIEYVYRRRETSEPGKELWRYICIGPDNTIKPAAAYSGYQVQMNIPTIDQKPNP